jgi:signal recognition particle subunit SRP54
MADQILGMGDIVSLVEQAQEVVDQKQALEFQKKAKKATWDLEDFLTQMRQIKKMGSIADLMKKIPGMNQMMGGADLDGAEDELKYVEAIICSMTVDERKKPRIINGSRRRRIAMGSGTEVRDVNRLLKDFEKSKKMMKAMMKGGKKGMRGRGPRGGMPAMPGM